MFTIEGGKWRGFLTEQIHSFKSEKGTRLPENEGSPLRIISRLKKD
jgi:hypothetical protein